MKIGKRIRFFRILRGMTQRELGRAVGFPEKTADVRVAQYENGERKPKAALRERFADALGVSVAALAIPALDTPAGTIHALFAMEDLYGFQIAKTDDGLVLRLQASPSPRLQEIWKTLTAWERYRAALDAGLCSREIYDRWRYQLRADGS